MTVQCQEKSYEFHSAALLCLAGSWLSCCTVSLQFGEWEDALAQYVAKKDHDTGIPMSPTGLARQATRKISGLSRSATLTRQATVSLSNAGGKRAQALEGLKQQVEDLKTKLQVCTACRGCQS